MRHLTLAAVLLFASAPVIAVDAPAGAGAAVAHRGDMLRDVYNVRLGAVSSVAKDGSVSLIYDAHFVTVPGDSLSLVNGKLVTKLSKSQISSL